MMNNNILKDYPYPKFKPETLQALSAMQERLSSLSKTTQKIIASPDVQRALDTASAVGNAYLQLSDSLTKNFLAAFPQNELAELSAKFQEISSAVNRFQPAFDRLGAALRTFSQQHPELVSHAQEAAELLNSKEGQDWMQGVVWLSDSKNAHVLRKLKKDVSYSTLLRSLENVPEEEYAATLLRKFAAPNSKMAISKRQVKQILKKGLDVLARLFFIFNVLQTLSYFGLLPSTFPEIIEKFSAKQEANSSNVEITQEQCRPPQEGNKAITTCGIGEGEESSCAKGRSK